MSEVNEPVEGEEESEQGTPQVIDYSNLTIIELLMGMAGQTEVPKEFYFWAGMSLVAACLQSRVYYQHMAYKAIRPNMYIFLVGESGDGKGHAIGMATKIGAEIEYGEANINLGRVKGRITAAALYDLLAAKPDEDIPQAHPVWLQSEELSNSIRVGEVAREFLKTMTDLWESHGGEVLIESTRGNGVRLLVDPCINWLAGSTMTWLREVIDPSDVDSGFFGRTIVIAAKRSNKPIYQPNTSLYEQLLPFIKEKLSLIWTYEGEMVFTEEAKEYAKEWYEEKTQKAPKKSFLFPTWKRRLDIMHKFAMLLQVARAKVDGWNVITLEVLKQAVVLYDDLLRHYEFIIENIILGKTDKKMERVVALFKKYKVITKVKLQQNMSGYGVRKDELNLILATLLEQRSISQSNVLGTTKVQFVWLDEEEEGE